MEQVQANFRVEDLGFVGWCLCLTFQGVVVKFGFLAFKGQAFGNKA